MQHVAVCSYRVSSSVLGNDPAAVNPYKPTLLRRAVIINLLTQTQCTQPALSLSQEWGIMLQWQLP